ncbi:MAG: hypothetical protein AMXMBFR34_43600 [Myxococcaceae bacterium]
MDGNKLNNISLTPTVARQTPRNEFGNVLKNTLEGASKAVGVVSGALMGSIPGGGVISAAVSSVTNLASSGGGVASAGRAASGVQTVSSSSSPATGQVTDGGTGMPDSIGDMVNQMRAEANRSMLMQMNMQSESREYNAVSNVLKVRHDSAKSAINNIR